MVVALPIARVSLHIKPDAEARAAMRADPSIRLDGDGLYLLAAEVGALPSPERGVQASATDVRYTRRGREYDVLATPVTQRVRVDDRVQDGAARWRVANTERLARTIRLHCERAL